MMVSPSVALCAVLPLLGAAFPVDHSGNIQSLLERGDELGLGDDYEFDLSYEDMLVEEAKKPRKRTFRRKTNYSELTQSIDEIIPTLERDFKDRTRELKVALAKFKERQEKLVSHREKRSKVQTENGKELQSKELAAKKQTQERKKKLRMERKSKDRCTVTAYDHENFMGMVVTKETICATRLTIEMPKRGRRRGYNAKSFKLSSGCRQVQLWDEDKCRINYKDNVNIKSSTTDVKWNLNNDVCAITVWANRHGWCEPDAPHVHRKFEEIHSTFGGTVKRRL